MQYLYRPNECQMTFQEAGARQVYGRCTGSTATGGTGKTRRR